MKHRKQLKKIGLKIKELRELKKLTQQALAYDCDVNLSTIQRVESGTQNLSVNILFSIAEVLQIDVKELF